MFEDFFFVYLVIEFVLSLEHALAATYPFSHHSGNFPLSAVMFGFVQCLSHKVIVRGGDFVHHNGSGYRPTEQFPGINQVDDADSCHYGSPVGHG